MNLIFAREEDNNLVVLEREDRSTFTVSRGVLPAGAAPGDSLRLKEDGTYELLPEESKGRKERVQKLLDELFEA